MKLTVAESNTVNLNVVRLRLTRRNEPDWHALGLRRPDEYQMTRAGAPGRVTAYVWLTPTEAVTVRPMELNDRVDWLKSKGCGLDASQPVKESQGF